VAAVPSPTGTRADALLTPPSSSSRLPHLQARRALDPTAACVRFAQAAATVNTATTTLGQARQAAARAYGTVPLRALYGGAGDSRNLEQETWQLHRARVTAVAAPVAAAAQDELDVPSTEQPRPGTPVAVTVTGTARGTAGWTAPIASYRLDCLTVLDPVAGWLVDDVAVTALPPVPAPAAG